MEEIYHRYRERAQFLLVYIREAHPADGWQLSMNEAEGIVYNEPQNMDERLELASQCVAGLDLSMTTLIDDMQNTADKAYKGHPDRLYIVGVDGKIAYASERGPGGFRLDILAEELAALFPDA